MKTVEEKQEQIFNNFVDECKAAKLTKKEIHIVLCNLLANVFSQVHLIGVIGKTPNRVIYRYNHNFTHLELIGVLDYSKMNLIIDHAKPEQIERFISKPKK